MTPPYYKWIAKQPGRQHDGFNNRNLHKADPTIHRNENNFTRPRGWHTGTNWWSEWTSYGVQSVNQDEHQFLHVSISLILVWSLSLSISAASSSGYRTLMLIPRYPFTQWPKSRFKWAWLIPLNSERMINMCTFWLIFNIWEIIIYTICTVLLFQIYCKVNIIIYITGRILCSWIYFIRK